MKITIIFIIAAAVGIYLLRYIIMYFTKKVVEGDEDKKENQE